LPKDNRHTSALLFTGLIAAPLLFIVLLQGLQLYVRHQLKERLEREAQVHLAIPAGELVWIKKGRELLVDGKMFDITTIRYEGNTALVTGIFDPEETGILHLLKQQASSSRGATSLAHLFVWLQQFVATGTTLTFSFGCEITPLFAPFTLAPYTSPVLSLLAPPPQG
jgi:hypothetical protein